MSIQRLPSQPTGEETARSPLPGELIRTIARAPTSKTVRRRTSLPIQVYRFTAATWQMPEIVGRTHQH